MDEYGRASVVVDGRNDGFGLHPRESQSQGTLPGARFPLPRGDARLSGCDDPVPRGEAAIARHGGGEPLVLALVLGNTGLA